MTAVEQLKHWVEYKHAGQGIRRTKEPYFNHLLAVANLAAPAADLGYEIGLCHDLLEDTDTSAQVLMEALLSFGYTWEEAGHICLCVQELTDVFTRKAFPHLSKKTRKKKEHQRLGTISADAQTVKYADLMYNVGWVLRYDHKHAKRYLRKKLLLIGTLTKGDEQLRQEVLELLNTSIQQISSVR